MVTRIIAKTALFDSKGNVLLLIRSDTDKHRPGGYDLPGGNIDPNESYDEAAIREAYEESGITLQPTDLKLRFATCKTAYHTEVGDTVNLVWLGYVAKLSDGIEIRLSSEHKSYELLPIGKAIDISTGATHSHFLEYLHSNGIEQELWNI